MTLGNSVRTAVSEILGISPDELDECICQVTVPLLAKKGNPYSYFAGIKELWEEDTTIGPPPFTALLYVLSHAAERMHSDGEFRQSNYYQRLHEITGLEKQRLSLNGKYTLDFWLSLNRWLRDNDYQFGRPTAQPINAWKYVSYALSQAVVRMADRPRFYAMFEEYGFSGNDEISEDEIAQILDEWMHSTAANARLKNVWAKNDAEIRRRVAQAALEALQDWSAGGEDNGDQGGETFKHLSLVASFKTYPKSRVSFSLGFRGELPSVIEDLQEEDGASEKSYFLSNQYYGGFATLGPDSEVNLPGALLKGITLTANNKQNNFRRVPRLIIPMIRSDNGAYWVEVSRASLATEHMVLCRDTSALKKQVEDFLAEVCIPGTCSVFNGQELAGLPVGWILYKGVRILDIPQHVPDNIMPLAPLSTQGKLHLQGGIRLGVGIWHSQSLPKVIFESDRGPTSIEFLQEKETGEQVLLHSAKSDHAFCELKQPETTLAENSSYIIKAYRKGKFVDEQPILLRSAERPRILGRADAGINIYRDIAGVENGSADAGGLFVQGHCVTGDTSSQLDSEIPTQSGVGSLTGEQEREQAPQANVSLPVHVEDTACVVRGHHVWDCEEFRRGEQRSAPKRMECKDCHQVVIARNRTKKKTAKKEHAKEFHAAPKADQLLEKKAETYIAIDPNLAFDALCFLGSGKWKAFEDLVTNEDMQPWQARSVAQDFAALGLVDLALDQKSQRIRGWSVSPPTIAFLSNGTGFLSGFRNRRLIDEISDALTLEDGVLETVHQDNAPDFVRVVNITPEAAHSLVEGLDLRDANKELIRVVPRAAATLALACKEMGSLNHALMSATVGQMNDAERFDPRTGKWARFTGNAGPGAYRFQYAGTSYAYRSAAGQSYLGRFEVVKLLAARDEGIALHSYDAKTQEFKAALGCEPIGLLRRTLVACSGQLPRRSGGVMIYPDVPKDIAATVFNILYKGDHLP